MKKKRFIYSFSIAVISSLVCVGVVYAASYDITSRLGGKSGDSFDIKGTLLVNSIKVGRQGTGGVTFFNGTIINNTTGTGGANNPVTFGDNVRIDGTLYRGATAGTTDTLPFKINDNLEVAGSLTIDSLANSGIIATTNLADSAVTSAKIADGTIATGDIADSAVTSAKIADGTIVAGDLATSSVTASKIQDGTVTTGDLADSSVTSAKIWDGAIVAGDIASNAITEVHGNANSGRGSGMTTDATSFTALGNPTTFTTTNSNSNILIMFSGTFSNVSSGGSTEIGLQIDGANYGDATRRGTANLGGDRYSLAFTLITNFYESGSHIIQPVWYSPTGLTSTMYDTSFQVLELKR